MSKINLFLTGLLFLTIAFSCQKVDPANDLSFEDQDIYVTNHDKNFDFNTVKTYFISNKVTPLKLTSDTTQYKNVDTAFISLINTNLAQRGFIRVDKNANPDVIVIISRLLFYTGGNDFSYINNGIYEGLANPDTILFPKPFSAPLEFTNPAVISGSLSIDMVNAKSSTDSLNIIWNGIVVGALISAFPGTEQRTKDGINSLFKQSPYLFAGQ
ncbi:hypothetical protein MYP_2436 [Sporocytophaga myxococcoides]|uniref:DUF4136 domain-containing protein n=1 Tax=Sporocytophaga myxococcoides TaxID=153721 RepID=A0A098LFD8_9BACT|nr:DUF4136 domain-containing protein [Sporocytophaga myxococcoides]GAL85207.1 hypothetical protein MYP_2436 [Sporocytophaga myxococcoides]